MFEKNEILGIMLGNMCFFWFSKEEKIEAEEYEIDNMNFMTVVKNTALSGLIERKNQIKTIIQTRYKKSVLKMLCKSFSKLSVYGDYGCK